MFTSYTVVRLPCTFVSFTGVRPHVHSHVTNTTIGLTHAWLTPKLRLNTRSAELPANEFEVVSVKHIAYMLCRRLIYIINYVIFIVL